MSGEAPLAAGARQRMRALHRVVGLAAAVLIVAAAITGLLLSPRVGSGGRRSGLAPRSPYETGFLAAAARGRTVIAGARDGLFRSTDGGATWSECRLRIPAEQVVAVAFRPGSDSVLAGLARTGVLLSTDGGQLWRDVPLPVDVPSAGEVVDLEAEPDGSVWIALSTGLARRSAGGEWVFTRSGAPPPAAWREVVHAVHTGWIGGPGLVVLVDLGAVALVVLVVSGVVLGFGGRPGRGRGSGLLAVAGAAVLGAARAAGASAAAEPVPVSGMRAQMGTFSRVTVLAPDRPTGLAWLTEAFAELDRLEARWSDFRPESEVGRLNAAPGTWVEVSPETAELARGAAELAHATGGAFCPTIGPLVDLWRASAAAGALPAPAALLEAQRRAAGARIEVNGRQVRIAGRARFDPGGIGKGAAAERAARLLAARGARSALVAVGGDIYALGRPGPRGWPVEIQDPSRPDTILGTLFLADQAISSSGNYARQRVIAGTPYGHLLDPRTGRPVDHVLGSTVIAPGGAEADALATALCVLPAAEGLEVAASRPGVQALLVTPPGADGAPRLLATAGFPAFADPPPPARTAPDSLARVDGAGGSP